MYRYIRMAGFTWNSPLCGFQLLVICISQECEWRLYFLGVTVRHKKPCELPVLRDPSLSSWGRSTTTPRVAYGRRNFPKFSQNCSSLICTSFQTRKKVIPTSRREELTGHVTGFSVNRQTYPQQAVHALGLSHGLRSIHFGRSLLLILVGLVIRRVVVKISRRNGNHEWKRVGNCLPGGKCPDTLL